MACLILADLLEIEELRDRLPLAGGAQVLGRILVDRPFAEEEAVEVPEGGKAAGDGPGAESGLVQMVQIGS